MEVISNIQHWAPISEQKYVPFWLDARALDFNWGNSQSAAFISSTQIFIFFWVLGAEDL